MRIPQLLKSILLLGTLGLALSALVSPALAFEGIECANGGEATGLCAPGWEVTSHSNPTDIPPGGRGYVVLDVFNVGAANSVEGDPVTVTDVLPAGVTALYAGGAFRKSSQQTWDCTGNGGGAAPGVVGASVVTCTNDPLNQSTVPGAGAPLSEFGLTGSQGSDRFTHGVYIEVAAEGPPRTVINRATVAGGGAAVAASTSSPLQINSEPAKFGIANWDAWFSNADGTLDTQAGSHPYEATFDLEINTGKGNNESEESGQPLNPGYGDNPAGGELRDVTVDLPPGFVGNPTAVPQCPREKFDDEDKSGNDSTGCPSSTIIGNVSSIIAAEGVEVQPIYNLVPPPGVAAEFGFIELDNPILLDSSVRTGGDSGIVTHVDNLPQARGVSGAVTTLWGVPGDPSFDPSRCDRESTAEECPSGAGTAPLLTLPTACRRAGEPAPHVTVHVSEWQDPSVSAEKTVVLHDSDDNETGFDGCEHLSFAPTISTEPDTTKADTPAGLTVEVKPPLGGLSSEEGLSTADIQNTTVTLPEGMVINPGQAAGLQACQAGNVEGGDDLPLPGENGEEEQFAGPAKCPSASKVGTVTIKTPLIEGGAEKQLEGNVYVLQSNPPEIKLLVTASADGVNVKLDRGRAPRRTDRTADDEVRRHPGAPVHATSSWRSVVARRRRWTRRRSAGSMTRRLTSRRGAARS